MTSSKEVQTLDSSFLHKSENPRSLLNLRLTGNVKVLLDLLLSSVNQGILLLPESSEEKVMTDFLLLLNLLRSFCQNYDFSTEFASYGGHLLLKKILGCDSCSCQIVDAVEGVIGSISSSGCYFPIKNMLSTSNETIFNPPTRHRFCDENTAEFSIYLRKIPLSMYGTGQDAVGYILWSSAVILSRFLVNNKIILHDKNVLECGAGLGILYIFIYIYVCINTCI
jgi:hypothetical protein